jgi:hypothetical protein
MRVENREQFYPQNDLDDPKGNTHNIVFEPFYQDLGLSELQKSPMHNESHWQTGRFS